ncbi:ubiquilin-1-like [Python bivittatus]|uniref:Ubiquilin-1-like n=1 Tax=Python bivittatus TaxID=176946 RepID=A0A9F3W1U6_PYTBI|nr:ubiquilin-1-like [Python bivittatus]
MSKSTDDPRASPVESTHEPKLIQVILKSSVKTQDCQVAENSTIAELKQEASLHFLVNKEQMLLVFAGKILQDQDTLLQHDIQDGVTVHLVVKRAELRHSPALQAHSVVPGCSTPDPAASVSNPSRVTNLQTLLGNIRKDLVTLLEILSELPQDFQHYPELMFQVVQSPTVQSLISSDCSPLTVAFILGVSTLISLRSMKSRAEKEKVVSNEEVAQILEKAVVQNILANTKEMAQFLSESPELKKFAQETPQFGRLLSLSGLTKMMVIYKKLPQLTGTLTPDSDMSLEGDMLDEVQSFRQLFVDICKVLSSSEAQDELEERMLRHTLETSPSLLQLAKENVSISHMLNNPKIVGEIIRYIRSPEVRQEMDRHCDRILSNTESFPGGYYILQSMYKDIEEPFWNAVQQQHESPFAPQVMSPSSNHTIPPHCTENRKPLPDPWVPRHLDTRLQVTDKISNQRSTAEERNLCPDKASEGALLAFSLESSKTETFLLPEMSNASPEIQTSISFLQDGEPPVPESPASQTPEVESQALQEPPGQPKTSQREGMGSQELMEMEAKHETYMETPLGSDPH